MGGAVIWACVFFAMYLWAGLTVAWALHMFIELGDAMKDSLPEHVQPPDALGNWKVFCVLIVIWPIALPVWFWQLVKKS